jgi:hypothetical protein
MPNSSDEREPECRVCSRGPECLVGSLTGEGQFSGEKPWEPTSLPSETWASKEVLGICVGYSVYADFLHETLHFTA